MDPTAPRIVDRITLEEVPLGTVARLRVWLTADGLGDRLRVPVLVVRGALPGPVVGVVAALHGNELNGIPVIHELVERLDPATLRGSLIAVPVINIPGYHLHQREFLDGVDLNRVFPGREGGTPSQIFATRLLARVIAPMDYLFDLHTASFGRTNSLYVRADLNDPVTSRLARLCEPEILLHNFGTDGTLRSAAASLGIHAITVEIGNPQRFQAERIQTATRGLQNLLAELGLIERPVREPSEQAIVCQRSYWLHTEAGGVLEVLPELLERIHEGQEIGVVRGVFGEVLARYYAPEAGVVIGRSSNPVAPTGSRILHLGVPGDPADITSKSPRP